MERIKKYQNYNCKFRMRQLIVVRIIIVIFIVIIVIIIAIK